MIEFISRLPQGYQEVEYIESSGTQYIDTGFVVNKPDSYVLEIDGLFSSQSQAYQGCNGYMQFYVSSVYGISADSTKAVGNRDIVKIAYANQTAVLSVNGVQIESKSWASYSGADVKLGVLRMGDANNGWFNGGAASGTIYGYKMWKNNILVSECVPCVRNSDGIAGMYDVIREQFITNVGSGIFAVGLNVGEIVITPGGVIPFAAALRRRIMSGGGAFEFTYTGQFTDKIEGSNRVIKLTSSGTLNVSGSVIADVYLLAGGGGAACNGGGNGGGTGGGGGNKVFTYKIVAGQYDITVGKGGNSVKASNGTYAGTGGNTSAFGEIVTGGTGGMCGTSSGATGAAGRGGTPNGGNGRHPLYGTIEGGSPNGGGMSAWEPQSGGDGYITITIPI